MNTHRSQLGILFALAGTFFFSISCGAKNPAQDSTQGGDAVAAPEKAAAPAQVQTDFSAVEQQEKSWVSGDGLTPGSEGWPAVDPALVAAAGNAEDQAHTLIWAVDYAMRSNYAENHTAIGKTIYPFLYAEFTPGGGRYTLLVDSGQTWSEVPTPAIYQDVKSISHIPLGIFVIIDRYFTDPSNGQWIEALQEFREKLHQARQHISKARMSPAVLADNKKILDAAIAYIDGSVKERTVTLSGFKEFSNSIGDEIIRNQTLAAETQVNAFTDLLLRWRKRIGEKAWSQLYAVSSAQWTLSTENVHALIISNMMSPQKAASRVFVTSMPLKNIDEARALVGRVAGDRVMAQAILPTKTLREREDIHALSSSRDLISRAAEDALRKLDERLEKRAVSE